MKSKIVETTLPTGNIKCLKKDKPSLFEKIVDYVKRKNIDLDVVGLALLILLGVLSLYVVVRVSSYFGN